MFLQPTHAALGPFCRACSSSSAMLIGSSLIEPCDDDALPLDSTPSSPALSTCISCLVRLADERSALEPIEAFSCSFDRVQSGAVGESFRFLPPL